MEWSEELRQLVDLLEEDGDYAFSNYTDSGFDTAWQRVRAKMKKAGKVPFQFKHTVWHSILTDRNTSSNKTFAYSETAIPFL